ncbi:Membrane-associated tyrosine- and threonine-specific cdc2-inhibitory kinase [Gigaspora margarita]|uniref:Membrane-associated tyrosine- and threonine-specific cdc2-inhibitory kinase n=2 Tax=Gigaspora margarita TaxID=4874 RepID=A0A8H3XJU8_GIGMA|nr:Membrane-associated tyrosine- and threonine-specific cdc2-inhibitory kinase [Gigaspora margarita]
MLENSNFEIEKVINHGNSAIVFEATEKDTKKSYAIKKSLPNPICGNYFFHNEIKIMKLITPHLNCVKFFDHWEYNKHIVLQIELCDGTLLDLIYGGNISISNVWHILLDIGFGIEHIHRQNVVHLDLKPENILVSNNRFKIGDFGLALRLPVDTDDPELHVGDRKYVALEVLEDNIISKPADVFSFGMIILHIISTGDLPNRGDNWLKIRNGDLSQFTFKVDSQDLINLTKGMIKKEIKERQTIKEIIIHIIKFIYEQI